MLNIAICNGEEEEIEAIRLIVEAYMNSYAIIYNIQLFDSGEALIEANTQFDFVLLDIFMKDANGIEIGMKLYQRNSKIKIIYVTHFNEYWKDAINQAHAFAYLSKPVDKYDLTNQIYEYSGTMAGVGEKMQMYGFAACYRGILVNFEHVTRAKGNTVYLNNGERLPLSQKRTVKFKNQLNDYNNKRLC